MITKNSQSNFHVVLIGTDNFIEQTSAGIKQTHSNISIHQSNYANGWSLVLTHKPRFVIIEIGYSFNSETFKIVQDILSQIKDRFSESIFVAAALTAPERLLYGGDLLYTSEDSLEPSCFLHAFLANPPGFIPNVSNLTEQLNLLISLFRESSTNNQSYAPPLQPLGSFGWSQSMADPVSLKLWLQWIPRYARYINENPLIIGETGVGKTKIAEALHYLSGKQGKFISITPRDFSSSELIQAELFGAVPGAYTGAVDKWGLVKEAEGGSLFIDELQSIGHDLQGKIITFIENKMYRRVGSAEAINADVRFIFASNRTLAELTKENVLRHDFAYRLERIQLNLPPLHLRPLDISAAIALSLAKLKRLRNTSQDVLGLNSDAYRIIFSNKWNGNLRQLENSLAKMYDLCDIQKTSTIDKEIVSEIIQSSLAYTPRNPTEVIAYAAAKLSEHAILNDIPNLQIGLDKLVDYIRETAIHSCGGDIEQAANLISDDYQLLNLYANVKLRQLELNKL